MTLFTEHSVFPNNIIELSTSIGMPLKNLAATFDDNIKKRERMGCKTYAKNDCKD
jgi:hypothetical protein